MIPYVYYVYDHDTDKTMYITEELDDAREWIDEHIGLGVPAKHHFTVMQIPAVRAFVASVTPGAL